MKNSTMSRLQLHVAKKLRAAGVRVHWDPKTNRLIVAADDWERGAPVLDELRREGEARVRREHAR